MHGVSVKTSELFFFPNFSSGSDTRVLTSAKAALSSLYFTASLLAVIAAANRYNFQTPCTPRRKGKKTLQVVVSMRVGSLVCAREQTDFFLLRKRPHNDSLVCSCEARELADGGRSPMQPQRSPGKCPWQPNSGWHVLLFPALRKTALPSWSLIRNW